MGSKRRKTVVQERGSIFKAMIGIYKYITRSKMTKGAKRKSDPSPMDIDKPRAKRCRKADPTRYRKATIPKTLRAAVWNKYIGEEIGATACIVCKNNRISQLNFVCGHVVAESCGGPTTVSNLRPICSQCNLSMGKQNLYQFKREYFNDRI